ncbi:unnamed protein product [Fraxinus pennsylvanica]|uniref:Uncharacterized protein n=1 Tax=Fraxinus pennsylvanica TaxID=56036 RepID=A0AAD2ALX6_9LAMI|nr:unnamed protein product [Fraxinus pennsylvanica]
MTMVGQAVTGVVEGAFGAGYVLNVRIGNSNTTLRGVVLEPGHYIPVGTAGANLKYASPKVVSSVPPDVLLPVIPSNGQPSSSQMPSDASQAASVLPPVQPRPAGQIPIVINPNLGTKLHKKVCRMKMLHQKMAPPRLKKEKSACNKWSYRWPALQDHQRFRTKMVRMHEEMKREHE